MLLSGWWGDDVLKAIEKQTIKALAECNLKTTVAARKLNCALPTLSARISNIKKQTGLDATNFYDLIKLLKYINE